MRARSRRSPRARGRPRPRAPVRGGGRWAAAGHDPRARGRRRRGPSRARRPSTRGRRRRGSACRRRREHDRVRRRREPGARPASGPSKATGRGRRGTSAGTAGVASGAATTRISVANGPDGVDGVVEQRPAVDGLGELVAPEPARPAAGEDDRGHGGPVTRGAVAMPAAAADPGTWPSGVRRRIARRSRSARIAITYLRLVPVASRRAAGVSGARRASVEGRRGDVAVGRRRIGEVRLEDDDPAARARARGRRRAGSRRRGPHRPAAAGGTASARSRRSIAAASSGSRAGAAGRRARSADRRAVAVEAAVRTSRSTRAAPAVAARAALDRRAAAERRAPRPRARRSGPCAGSAAASTSASSRASSRVRSVATSRFDDAVQVEPGGRDGGGVSRSDCRGERADPRRGLAATRDPARGTGSSTSAPTIRAVPDGPAEHEPVARRDRDRGRQAQDRRSCAIRQVEGVAAAPPDARVDAPRSRDGREPARGPGAAATRRTRSRSLATTARSSVRIEPAVEVARRRHRRG